MVVDPFTQEEEPGSGPSSPDQPETDWSEMVDAALAGEDVRETTPTVPKTVAFTKTEMKGRPPRLEIVLADGTITPVGIWIATGVRQHLSAEDVVALLTDLGLPLEDAKLFGQRRRLRDEALAAAR